MTPWRRARTKKDKTGNGIATSGRKVGVLDDELARPALFLNLPTRETESYGRPPGEPAYASLRVLLRSSPTWILANVYFTSGE
jgi:hypothetical protein